MNKGNLLETLYPWKKPTNEEIGADGNKNEWKETDGGHYRSITLEELEPNRCVIDRDEQANSRAGCTDVKENLRSRLKEMNWIHPILMGGENSEDLLERKGKNEHAEDNPDSNCWTGVPCPCCACKSLRGY